ncbi:phage holin family protein [Acetonema longum]|uniref:Phage holin family protein n=1 Tax=Acetonema longum DSM 6540 TaxID=1009370 RepID=F7NG93_9FIRM|nr:phage holin family protein [Acetonema longum]EGO65011.1 hypothetical protein ALO_05398 [Acetonema longum DSM 6540]
MKKFMIKCLANMLGIYVASYLFPSITISSVQTIFWSGLALGFVRLLLRPILLLVSLPINILTLGLFTLVINTWLVMLTARLIGDFILPSFMIAFATAFIISTANMLAGCLTDD